MNELKPCPFCGSKADLHSSNGYSMFAMCTNQGCGANIEAEDLNYLGPDIAVALWNRRDDEIAKLRTVMIKCADKLDDTFVEHPVADTLREAAKNE